jgi:hypothetical protein
MKTWRRQWWALMEDPKLVDVLSQPLQEKDLPLRDLRFPTQVSI